MASLLALCIEDLGASHPDEQFVRCVAVTGHAPGLGLDNQGQIVWREEQELACELLVTADQRLALWRREGATEIVVTRARRALKVPYGKPVILLHGDELTIASRRMRIHLHGAANAPAEPRFFVPSHKRSPVFRTAATAAIVGASLAASAAGSAQVPSDPIEVRETPPIIVPEPTDAGPDATEDAEGGSDDTEGDAFIEGGSEMDAPEIEVREHPPVMEEPPPPPVGCCAHQPGTAVARHPWRRKL